MDICIKCVECDEKLKERIKKKIRDNWNWPFENNLISKQETIIKYRVN